MLAHDASPALDYGYLTHFHDDHMGGPKSSSKTARGGYKLSGVTEVGDLVPIKLMLDRGWPDYNYPTPLKDASVTNYRAFLDWHRKNSGMQVERLQPGRKNQIVLRRDPAKYPNFEVRNVAANGEVWTGVGVNTRAHHPRIADLKPAEYPTENTCSLVIRVATAGSISTAVATSQACTGTELPSGTIWKGRSLRWSARWKSVY